jgi:hypothetical protein
MYSDDWADAHRIVERLAQNHPSPRPMERLSFYFTRQGKIAAEEQTFYMEDGPALPTPAAPRRSRKTDAQWLEEIKLVLGRTAPPGLRRADLAEELGRSRNDRAVYRIVDRLVADDKLVLDGDGYVKERTY